MIAGVRRQLLGYNLTKHARSLVPCLPLELLACVNDKTLLSLRHVALTGFCTQTPNKLRL